MNRNDDYTSMKDPKYCFVPACKNNSRDVQKTFFAVPSSNKQDWCNAVGIACPKRVIYVCEDHLNLEEDVENYWYWMIMKGRPKLKSRLPQSLVLPQTLPSYQDIGHTKPSTSANSLMEVDISETHHKSLSCVKVNKGVQVKPKTTDRTTYCAFPISKTTTIPVLEEDTEMAEEVLPSTQGSTTSADISEISSEFMAKTANQDKSSFMLNIIANKPQSYIGLPKKYYWLIQYLETNLKIKSLHLIITLYKIKSSIPFSQISDMFGVSLTTLWRIFPKTLCILRKFFEQFIFPPSVYNVKSNLPPCFKTSREYSKVYCIIDCFEISIEKPSNPITQALTWSQYKNANTLKYLLATTPEGFIIFISAGFGGRITDAQIVECSGLIKVLPSNSSILADRGFKHIDTLLSKKGITLLRPPSVSKDNKLTKLEAIRSKVIASLRIHVSRVIRRVRMFKILNPHSVINTKLIQNTDQIVIVACGLINLHTSVIKMNKRIKI